MRVSSSIKVFVSLAIGTLALGGALSACYNPNPQPGSFLCDFDAGGLCPSGFQCNPSGVCVRPGDTGDMLISEFDLSTKGDLQEGPRTCDQIVQAGGFSNLVELKVLNSTGDESHLAFDGTNQQLVFQRGSSLFSSSLQNGLKSPAAPAAITTPSGYTLNGGSFTSDGHYWFSGTASGTTQLFQGTLAGGALTSKSTATTASCPFSDPVFVLHSTAPTSDMGSQSDVFLAYPLAGCGGASYVARGAAGLNISAFYSALETPGFQAPSMTGTSLTLLVSSTGTAPRIYSAARSAIGYQFGSPIPVDMTGIGGAGTEDRQMVVSDDCTVAYFVTVRTGGTGGADIWAADIAQK